MLMMSEYEARKVGADLDGVLELIKKAQHPDVPPWFRWESGFTFYDEDGDPRILLGPGGWRNVDDKLHMTMEPVGVLCACRYKGEWHIGDLCKLVEPGRWWRGIRQTPEG